MTRETVGKAHGKSPGVPFEGAPGPLQKLVKDQRVLFLLVGAANTAFSTTLFVVLVLLAGSRIPAAVNVGIAWSVSLVVAFFAYRRLVFKVSDHLWRDFARFFSVNVSGLLINAAALAVLVDFSGLPAIPTQVCITVGMVVYSYLGHRYFSFRRRPARTEGGEK